jgi:hypothetical protein
LLFPLLLPFQTPFFIFFAAYIKLLPFLTYQTKTFAVFVVLLRRF